MRDEETSNLPPQTRRDVVTAAIIDTGIALAHHHGIDAADRYLRNHGVGLLTSLRVLVSPRHRPLSH